MSEEMEGHEKNSTKDTVPSDCEEISVNPSSIDTVSLFQERKRRHYKSKYEHRRRKPSNSIQNDKHIKHCGQKNRCNQTQSSDHRNKLETVTKQTITQEIHVQKNNFKCIINLNTTVCDHQTSINVEKPCSKKQHRPVPQCQKPLCRLSRRCGPTFLMHRKESCKRPSTEKAIRKKFEKQLDKLPFDQDKDHNSNKSLEKYSDIPNSYKNVVNHCKKYESKLDTLIKRTKERERKLVEQSRNNNNASSTYTDISSGEFPTYSEYAASLHSRSTLILDHQPSETEYSPNIESCYTIKTEKYSPMSFNEDLDSNFEMKIKSEFIMDM